MYSPELIRRLLLKMAFVDPSAAAGGGAPPMDPSMMGMGGGGAPPMDPAMLGALSGGAAAPGSEAGGLTEERVRQIVQEAVAQMGGSGGGSSSGSGGSKKKDDLATELHQIKKLLIYLMQASGLQLPPDFLLDDGEAAAPAAASASSASTPPLPQTVPGAIPPIEPIRPASSVLVGGQ